ncbi:30S ribosomal protein S6 [Patescibacteria group bacterium]|nr:30S ribosomal protein S6 [Patescibacteria group bacterium]
MSEKEVYEIGYLLLPSISEEDVLTEVANVKAILEKKGASFLSGDEPKLINLAYPISKMFGADKQIFEKAYFAWIKFEVEVEKVVALKTELDKYENIMRFLLIKTIKKDTLVSEVKKPISVKKDSGITDKDKEKEIEPVKIVKKEEVADEENKEEAIIEDVKEEVVSEDDRKEKEDLDETIENLIIK